MEVLFGHELQELQSQAKWFLMKLFCKVFQVLFPELNLHHRLLRVVLAELDDIENLSPCARRGYQKARGILTLIAFAGQSV